MTFQQFLTKWNGKYCEYHSFGAGAQNQCVDLANQYIVDVLNLPSIIGTNAQDFPKKAGSTYEWIVNTPSGVPKEGDIVVWKSSDNVGHIAVFIEGNASSFRSFDQNFPVGTPCHVQGHTYTNVLGWLRKKGATMDPEIIKRADAFIAVCEVLGKPVDKDIVIADIKRLVTLEDKLRERDQDLDKKRIEIEELGKRIEVLIKEKETLEVDNKVLFNQTEQQQRRLSEMTASLVETKKEIEELKKVVPGEETTFQLVLRLVKRFIGRR